MDLVFKSVDFHCESNNADHHTADISTEQLVVRRGQAFLLTVNLPQPFTPDRDRLLVTAVTGSKASQERGTLSVFGVPEGAAPTPSAAAKAVWKAELRGSSALTTGSVSLAVTPPADAPVGKYFLSVSKDEKETSLGSLVVLFNPWCSDDWVFLADEEQREEYVMNEQGIIYKGSDNYITSMAWDYGQFEENMVDICLKMLDVNPKHLKDSADDVSARCNPIYVGRVVSAMINSEDDCGVLEGCWGGNMEDGVLPTHWNGSLDILQLWHISGCHQVKYGQCWVFAGVMCSVMRCLGIPCRVVTNFQSAHDTHKNLTIDVFHADYGVRPIDTADSVWNFHVWVEAWMRRPDLTEDGSYDGWQVLDPTPQEQSKGVFCCGPAPVTAILNGDTHLKYDIPFVFAEVNADCIDWLVKADGSKIKIYSDTKRVGQNISTKSVGSSKRWNITDTYKNREGSKEERSVFKHAITRDYSRDGRFSRGGEEEEEEEEEEEDEGETEEGEERSNGVNGVEETPEVEPLEIVQPPQEVSMRFEEVSKPVNGQEVSLKLVLHSKDSAARPLSVNISIQAMKYTGNPAANIKTEVTEETLQPGQDLSIPVQIPFSVYGKYMLDNNSLKVSAVVTDKQQPDLIYLTETDIVPQDPPISITVLSKASLYREMEVEVLFKNPLDEPLTDCSLTVSGSGLLKHNVEEKLAVLRVGRQVRFKIFITPYKTGQKTLVVDFDCSAFRDIKSSCTFDVSPYSSYLGNYR
ncbi:protein-glutamine gamma-glutamyltransferase E [Centroberyx gerrardi]